MPSFGDELSRLVPHMRRFARALVRGHTAQVADDLVQKTVVLAMRAERMARGPGLRAWCFSSLMRVHRQWEQSLPSHAGAAPSAGAAAGAETLAFMPREIARLDALPLESREVLLLIVLVGMNYAQAAETLHVGIETVMARLDTARHILARGQRLPASGRAGAAGSQRTARAAQYLHVIK